MSDTTFKRAQITIYADTTPRIEHEFKGDPSLYPMVIGGMEIAKEWLIKSVRVQLDQTMDTREKVAQGSDTATNTQEVPKEKAIEAYQYAITCLTARIRAIESAPEGHHFLIEPDLLSRL
jgi:hypothetical protein